MTIEKQNGNDWIEIAGVVGIATLDDESGSGEEQILLTTGEALAVDDRIRFKSEEYKIAGRLASSARLVDLIRYVLHRT